ncbi:MAG: DUF3305 domain-containing protein [Hyphomicrobiaceae bacterium]|nr:DUF3305 domain-containing protein [Hyphomicrobiaceae bacterium]
MIEEKLTIGLVVERRRIDSEWAQTQAVRFAWRPHAVFPVAPDVAPWTPLGSVAGSTRYYAGAHDITLYSTETTNYRDNLLTDEPKLWVVLRPDGDEPPITIAAITADPAEGEAYTEAGTNTVETIPMPIEIATDIAGFIADYHVERPFLKRKRDRKDMDEKWRPGEGPDAHGRKPEGGS